MAYYRVNVTVLLRVFPARCFSSGKFLCNFICLFIFYLIYILFMTSNSVYVFTRMKITCFPCDWLLPAVISQRLLWRFIWIIRVKTLNLNVNYSLPVPVAARSKVWVCGRSLDGIVGSNTLVAWMFVSCECCVLSGRGLCVGLTTLLEEFYRVWCVWVWSWILDNEEVLAQLGLLQRGQKNYSLHKICIYQHHYHLFICTTAVAVDATYHYFFLL
jgi:hypothetical protein